MFTYFLKIYLAIRSPRKIDLSCITNILLEVFVNKFEKKKVNENEINVAYAAPIMPYLGSHK